MTTGWTFTKGSLGERVPEDTTIYSSKSCLTVIKVGVDKDQRLADMSGLSVDEAAQERAKIDEEYKRRREELNNEYTEYSIHLSTLENLAMAKRDAYYESVKEWNRFVTKYNKADETTQETMKGDLAALEAKRVAAENEKQAAIDEYFKYQNDNKEMLAEYFENKQPSTYGKQDDGTPAITASQEQMDAELEKLTNQINNMDIPMVSANAVATWFDAVERYIDNMPQFNEDTQELYEVEQQGNWWVYTGNSAVADPEFNKKIREWKQEQCKKINGLIDKVTAELEKKLNDLSKKCIYIMPLIEAIKVIQGGVSINTLVKWGKGVINFCTSIYQMFYTTYKTVMETMELLVVRIPQLISKMMDKVTELDCPIERRSIHVNIKQNVAEANKERQQKKGQ